MRKADNFTTILCRCHEIWEPSNSWNPLGHSRPVTGLLYLFYEYFDEFNIQDVKTQSVKLLSCKLTTVITIICYVDLNRLS